METGCVISFFYIKPQPAAFPACSFEVALYLSSTSNHNPPKRLSVPQWVALYLSSTSNHNHYLWHPAKRDVALYLSSTSNHNLKYVLYPVLALRYIFLLHQTTTRNRIGNKPKGLRYIFLLHQTTTGRFSISRPPRCVISFFYIKPQLILLVHKMYTSCVISFFYIKPQRNRCRFAKVFGCVISFFYIKPQPW